MTVTNLPCGGELEPDAVGPPSGGSTGTSHIDSQAWELLVTRGQLDAIVAAATDRTDTYRPVNPLTSWRDRSR